MKQIRGIWLPDDDTHFEAHLLKGPEFNSAGTYQYSKILLALQETPANRRGLFVDVGAHVGTWSRVMASHFHWVTAFEPMPEVAACWTRNMTGAGIQNADLWQFAVSHNCDRVDMHYEEGNSGNSGVVPPDQPKAAFDLSFETIDLDTFDFGRRIDLLKIDVEGWEQRVVAGGLEIIAQDRPTIVVEQKPGHAERYGLTRYGAVDVLKGLGMRVEWERAGDVCMGWPS